ncbi:MAG: SLBB domain-containing protein [Alphaproteobacteria bacterium]|nr:SLBB domain-containing protein [Alphaproteobacteria bacterium]
MLRFKKISITTLWMLVSISSVLKAELWVTQQNGMTQEASVHTDLIEKSVDLKKQQILLEGEVAKPGLYQFQKGTTLSKILIQAGGFTPIAYPIGAIFIRDFKNCPKLRDRMIVEADYVLLQLKPELDILIEPGDQLIIPKRPSHVWVSGDVVAPKAIQFESGLDTYDYIKKCGGLKNHKSGSASYVEMPNGEIQKLAIESWHYKKFMISPGSKIVVQ